MLLKPFPYGLVLVRRVVVQDKMQVHAARRLPVDFLQEPEPLHVGVLLVNPRYQLPVKIVEGGEKRRRAMPVVVVRGGPDMADAERQGGLRTLKRLYLRLLVAAQDDGLFGRGKVQPNHVPEFLLELRVVGKLEAMREVRFDVVARPYLMYSKGRDLKRLRDLAAAVHRVIPLRQGDNLLLRRLRYASGTPRTRAVVERRRAAGLETAAPCADGRKAETCSPCRLGERISLGRKDYHAAVGKPLLGGRRAVLLKKTSFLVCQFYHSFVIGHLRFLVLFWLPDFQRRYYNT